MPGWPEHLEGCRDGVRVLGEKDIFIGLPSEQVDSRGGAWEWLSSFFPLSQWGEGQRRNRKGRNFKHGVRARFRKALATCLGLQVSS